MIMLITLLHSWISILNSFILVTRGARRARGAKGARGARGAGQAKVLRRSKRVLGRSEEELEVEKDDDEDEEEEEEILISSS